MKHKHARLLLLTGFLGGLFGAAFLIFTAFQDTLVFFYTPSDLLQKTPPQTQRLRIGGLVEPQSLQKNGQDIRFKITDQKETLLVHYQGLLPDLFREGQGVVAEGYLKSPGLFQAETVLAKHDETYMPKNVADRLKKEGLWRND